MESVAKNFEIERCRNLMSYQIWETPSERVFDDLARLAAQICQTPMATVTLVDHEKECFKAKVGFLFQDTPKMAAFCAYTIGSSKPLIIGDATKDSRFSSLALVVGEPHIRFYAGVPLITGEGFAIGALCVLDRVPRELNLLQIRNLEDLAYQAMKQIERHRDSLKLLEAEQLIEVKNAKLIGSAKLASLGAMSASVAHEIDNPLTIIQGRAMLLSRSVKAGKFDRETIVESCDKITSTVGRITRIVQGLRNVSRMDGTEGFESVELQDWLEGTLSYCEEKFLEEGIPLKIGAIPRDVILYCRPVELSQVLLNLLNNAFDAVLELTDRWVKVVFHEGAGRLSIKIEDSGHGIPAAVVQRMFDPFFTTKAVGKGTGLGLSIARKEVESQHGELLYRDDCNHTCFEIGIPTLAD